jgi:hypothetical protein
VALLEELTHKHPFPELFLKAPTAAGLLNPEWLDRVMWLLYSGESGLRGRFNDGEPRGTWREAIGFYDAYACAYREVMVDLELHTQMIEDRIAELHRWTSDSPVSDQTLAARETLAEETDRRSRHSALRLRLLEVDQKAYEEVLKARQLLIDEAPGG